MTAVYWFHRAVGLLFKGLILPFKGMAPIWSLMLISLLTGVLMVWIFGKVSNQRAIRSIKNKIFGNLMGVRLYQDNVGVILKLQGRILRDTFIYMRYSLVPLLIMLVPVVIMMVHLEYYYGRRPLRVGESAIVKSLWETDSLLAQDIALAMPDGVALETPPVRIPETGEVAWRVRGAADGEYLLELRGIDRVDKQIDVGGDWGPISPIRLRADAAGLFLFPGERPIPADSPVRSVEISYPAASVSFLGISTHWAVWFLVLSLIFGFLVKDWLGVKL